MVLVSLALEDIVATMTCLKENGPVLVLAVVANKDEVVAETGDCLQLLLEDSRLFHLLSSLLVVVAIHFEVVASTWYM